MTVKGRTIRNGKSGGSRKRKRDDNLSDSSDERCFDCGKEDHRRGSPECQKPSYLTLMIRKRREDGNDVWAASSRPVLSPKQLPHILKSLEQRVLEEIKNVIGDKTASEQSLQFAPPWILQKAIDKERGEYRKHVEEVDIRTLPRDANVISSHHFFQVEHDGQQDSLKLNCRLVPHGNRDKHKDSIRSDSSTAQFAIIRIVLSIAATLSLSLATIDIKSTYLQGEDLPRAIYIRPPKGWGSSPRIVWKLLKPAYGLVESGRIWQLTVERWMTRHHLFQIPRLQQLFIQRDADGCIALAIAKVVDDFLVAGTASAIQEFHNKLSRRFTVGRFIIGKSLIYNRLYIQRDDDFSVHVNMKEYLQTIHPLDIPRVRRKDQNSKCTIEEISSFLSLTGSLNYLGHGVLPQASFAASHLQQMVGRLTVSCLVTANKTLDPALVYKSPRNLGTPTYLAFSDASQGRGACRQTGYVSGVFLPAGGERIYHVIDWQSRVSFSSIGAEILAAATSTDRGSLMAEQLQEVHGSSSPLPFILSVDSNGMYSTITTLHEGSDYRLRPTVQRMRGSFEQGEISVMQWVAGKRNPADALTKRNIVLYRKLNNIMCCGTLDEEIIRGAKPVTFSESHA